MKIIHTFIITLEVLETKNSVLDCAFDWKMSYLVFGMGTTSILKRRAIPKPRRNKMKHWKNIVDGLNIDNIKEEKLTSYFYGLAFIVFIFSLPIYIFVSFLGLPFILKKKIINFKKGETNEFLSKTKKN